MAYVEPATIHPPFALTFRRIDRAACYRPIARFAGPGRQLYVQDRRRLIDRGLFYELQPPSRHLLAPFKRSFHDHASF